MNYSSTHPQTSRSMICPLVKLGRSSPPKTEPKTHKMPLNERSNSSSPMGNNSECYRLELNYPHNDKFSSYNHVLTSPNLQKQQEQDDLYPPYFSQLDYKNNRQKLDSYELQNLPENRNYKQTRSRYDDEFNSSNRNLTRLSNFSISNELYWNGVQNSQDSEQSENGQKDDDSFQRYYQSQQRRISSPFSSYMTDNYNKISPFSPNCDQGYHTLLFSSQNSSSANLESWNGNTNLLKGKRVHQKESIFDKLPDDLVLRVFSYLHSFDLSTCAQVCRRFEHLAWKPCLWRTITFSGEQKRDDKKIRTDIRTILKQLCAQNQGHICLNIERVYISDGAKITDREIMFLARRCPELTHLQIHGCTAVTNVAIHELVTRCINLHHLDITGCTNVSSITLLPGPEPVLRLALQYLDLTDCVGINDHSLRIIVKSCPQLVYLYLRRCIQITDIGLKYVPSFCSGLREFSVSDCSKVTDFGLYELAKLGATLRYLSVAKCDQVSDAGLKVIARRCYKLRYLNARGCEAVSDDAITVLARSCTRLRALDIGKCDVSDAGLKALAECCPNIKKLSLRNCDLITNRGIKCIAYYCRGLQQLNIQDCQITIEGYRVVKQYCRRCIIEHTNPGFF